ncbi:hypothetical protein L917_10555, partial [Phytophthora nicotianae]
MEVASDVRLKGVRRVRSLGDSAGFMAEARSAAITVVPNVHRAVVPALLMVEASGVVSTGATKLYSMMVSVWATVAIADVSSRTAISARWLMIFASTMVDH